MKNQVIEVLDKEHGKKVIEYWKSKGIDTSGMLGIGTKKAGYLFRYYGVIDGCFDCYSEREAAENNAEIIELPEDKMYNKILNDMKNQVIEVLDLEHGNKVIEYWKSKGVDTRGMCGSNTKDRENAFRYYGVIGGYFGCCSISFIKENNAEIIELPTESPKEEKPFPRVMLVSDDGNSWNKRVVLMKRCDRYISWVNAETIEESEDIYEATSWRYAKEILEKVNITKAEIAEKFGIEPEQLEIVE